MKKRICGCISSLFSLAGIFLMTKWLSISSQQTYRFVWVFACAIAAVGNYAFFSNVPRFSKIQNITSFCLAFFFLFLQMYGYQIKLFAGGSVKSLLLCAAITICLAGVLAYPICLFLNADSRRSSKASAHKHSFWFVGFGILLLAWLPVFLAYYPGLFTYDVSNQLPEYLSGQISSWHPPLHTYWLGKFYDLGPIFGSHTFAFSLHILMQMSIMAFIFSYIVYDLYCMGCQKCWCIGLLAIFAIFPVHSILAISCTKDVAFCGCFSLLVLQLYHLWNNPQNASKPRFWIKLWIFTFLSCQLRNNAVYALILFCPFALFLGAKANRKKCFLLLFSCVALAFCSYRGTQLLFPKDPTMVRESLSIPSQQLARTLQMAPRKEFAPYKAEMRKYMASAGYHPNLADSIKGHLYLETSEETVEFLKLWLRVGVRYPITYLDAFLQTVQGMWWIDDTTHAEIYGKGLEGRQGYLLTDTKPAFNIEHHSLFPSLENLYERLFSANEYQKIPLLSFLFAPAFYFWFTLLMAARAFCTRQRAVLAACLLLLCYAGTLFLAPCVLIRYAYPLVTLAPVLLALTFHSPRIAD